MKFVAVLIPLFAASAVALDVDNTADNIPSCFQPCLSDLFSTNNCDDGDWQCFCKKGITANTFSPSNFGSDCQSSLASCSTSDATNSGKAIGRICVAEASGTATDDGSDGSDGSDSNSNSNSNSDSNTGGDDDGAGMALTPAVFGAGLAAGLVSMWFL